MSLIFTIGTMILIAVFASQLVLAIITVGASVIMLPVAVIATVIDFVKVIKK